MRDERHVRLLIFIRRAPAVVGSTNLLPLTVDSGPRIFKALRHVDEFEEMLPKGASVRL